MAPEGHKPFESHLLEISAIIGILVLSQFAFSKKVRQQIKRRDGYKSVWSGKTEGLEIAHIDHDRDNPRYNDASNGRTLTTGEHFWDHVNRHGRNGLTEAQNNWSIMMIWRRFWGLDREE